MNPAHTLHHRSARRQYRIIGLALIALLGAILVTMPAKAAPITATVAIASFDGANINGFQLNGSAALNGTDLRLTSAITDQAGSAFWTNRVSLANQRSFSTYFVMDMPDPGTSGATPAGADGIVFTIQTNSNTAGGGAGGIGYAGISPSIGVEFDTYQNSYDLDDNHVGFNIGGAVNNALINPSTVATPPGVLQGNIWHVWVDYNGGTNMLQVRMNSTNNRNVSPTLEVTHDIASDIGQDVYVGFTAGTGGSFENHDIKSFYFVNDYAPIDTRPPNDYQQAPAAIDLSPSPASITTGASSTITATVRDPAGNVMANQPVTLSTSLGSLSATSGTTNASGQIVVTLNDVLTASTVTIRATTAGGVVGTTTVAVTGPTITRMYVPFFWRR